MNTDEADARCDFEIEKRREQEIEDQQRREREWLAATGEPKTWREIDALIQKHGIKTSHVYPPIPIRSMDWQAFRDNDEPDDNGHMFHGSGPSEMAAVADLIETLESAGVA